MDGVAVGSWTGFVGSRKVAAGAPGAVVASLQPLAAADGYEPVWVFDDTTGAAVEVDWRGTVEQVRERVDRPTSSDPAPAARGPGRPKLGVVAREVTLLPRHWEWLSAQPGGASVALRKLVDEARRDLDGTERVRKAREAAYRFLGAMAGDLPGFEEATRALFAGDASRFEHEMADWPSDVRSYVQTLASASFAPADAP